MEYTTKKTYEKKVTKKTKFDIGDIVQYGTEEKIVIFRIDKIEIYLHEVEPRYISMEGYKYDEKLLTLVTKHK